MYRNHTTGQYEVDPSYTGQPVLQIIECKYSTDHNVVQVMDLIKQKYQDLATKIAAHGAWPGSIEIVPIVITRTGHYHEESIRQIVHLFALKNEPPDRLGYKDVKDKDTIRVLRDMHTLAVKWLHKILQVARLRLKPKINKRTLYTKKK